jgi:hypothetical protein
MLELVIGDVLGHRPKLLGFISGPATGPNMSSKRLIVKDRERKFITWHWQPQEEER